MRRAVRRVAIAGLAVATLSALAGCGGSNAVKHSGSTTPATPSGPTIVIKDFKFTVPASVSPGATITVRNEDSVAHTVTATSGHAFDAKVGGSSSTTFSAPTHAGSYSFTCTYHPYMHATLTVTK